MLGISRRGEGAHVIYRCLAMSILSSRQCIIEFFGGVVWKLGRVQGKSELPSLTPPTLTQSADR